MHLYAIYYYRRAAALRPYDSRMWWVIINLISLKFNQNAVFILLVLLLFLVRCAMGLCFERLGRLPEAVQVCLPQRG